VLGCVSGVFVHALSLLFLLPFAVSSAIHPRKVSILHLMSLLYPQDPFAALFSEPQKMPDSLPRSVTPFLSPSGIKMFVDQVEVLQSIPSKNDASFLILKSSIPVPSYASPHCYPRNCQWLLQQTGKTTATTTPALPTLLGVTRAERKAALVRSQQFLPAVNISGNCA